MFIYYFSDILAQAAIIKYHISTGFVVFFSCSVMCDSLWPDELQHTRLPCPSPSWSLPKLMSIESVILSNHPILCRPLLLLPSVFPSIRVCFNESALRMRWPKDWSFSISLSSEHSGLISFKIDWFDLLAVKGTLRHLLQHQLEGINSSALSLFNCPSLTFTHGYWKIHSFDYTDLCRASDVHILTLQKKKPACIEDPFNEKKIL